MELKKADGKIFSLIEAEKKRRRDGLEMIASENYVSEAVLEATGSILTNKYAEGYPGKRYYEGQQITDLIESLAIERAQKLFKVDHANVQSHSGAVANLAAYSAVAAPGDTIMGLALPYGGHLSHGWKVNFTSKIFNSVSYELDPVTGQFDFNKIEELAKKHKPKVIISGASAYPRTIDFKSFGEIAKRVGAYHLSDIAHISGLVVAGLHPSPVPYADIVSTTTHKTLRGPRGGMLLCKAELAEAIDKAVFPGLQGGPHMHTISALAVALKEADSPEFVEYAKQIIKNAKVLADCLMEKGFNLFTCGTDNHLILIDLRNKNIPGKKLAKALDRARIETNYNTIPGDPAKPFNPNGLRIGTPAITTRGMKEEQMKIVASLIAKVADNIDNEEVIAQVGRESLLLCSQFPVPEHFIMPAGK